AANHRYCGKYKRFYDHEDGALRIKNGADIDVIKILEFKPVDGDDWRSDFHFFAKMNPDQPADITVADEHDRMSAGKDLSETVANASAHIIEPLECRRAAPWHEQRPRPLAVVEFASLERGADRRRHLVRLDLIVIERQRRRDHRHVAQRQYFERRDEDRAT